MRITPQGTLADFLRKQGRDDLIGGFELDADRLQRFIEESKNGRLDHLTEEERDCWAIWCAVTHPGWKAKQLGEEVAGVASVDETSEVRTIQAPAEQPVPARPFMALNESVWSLAWRIAVLILLFLIAVGTMRGQTPHDPIIIRGADEGTNLFTLPAGLVRWNCVGAGITCTWAAATSTFAMTVSGGGGGGTVWSDLIAPVANLSLAHGTNTTTFTWSTGTSTSNLFTLQDTTGNTGTGYLFNVHSIGTSTLLPLRFTAGGTANGVDMDTTGLLKPIGTGGIRSSSGTGAWSGATTVDVATGYRIGGAAASGNFLRGNGTNFVSAVIGAGDLPTGIDASKISGGTVSNSEFDFLNGVTSAIQTQLDAKVPATRILTAGAGLSGGGDLSADRAFATASGEADFIASGALLCGAGTQGKMQVHTTPLQYCDNAATPVLQYAAYADSSGNAMFGDSATSFFSTGTLENARLDSDLAALGDNATNGFWARTGAGTGAARTFSATAPVAITNGSGGGNPDISLNATTYQMSILGWTALPDSSGNVFFEPYPVKATNEFWKYGVFIFNDTATDDCVYSSFTVPGNYVDTATWKFWTSSTATSGNYVLEVAYRNIAGDDSASLDQSTAQQTQTVTDAAPSSVDNRLTPTITPTAGNFAAGNTVQVRVCRAGTSGSDTMAAALQMHGAFFEYSGRP